VTETEDLPLPRHRGRRKTAGLLLRWLESNRKTLKRLVILTHDHPDPDALSSAWALAYLAKKLARAQARIVYGGAIGRRENRMMWQSLGIPASPVRPADLEAPAIALIDTQPPFKNNRFPPRRKPSLIVDHHPLSPHTRAGLTLVDEGAGATATILTEAFQQAGIPVPIRLATALVYGIGAETQNLGREAGPRDAAAYTALLPSASLKALWRITNPPKPASLFRTIARAIRHAFMVRNVIGVHLRELSSPDSVAQMADFLLSHEGMQWSLVTGRYGGRLFVSLRTTSLSEHSGRILRRVLGGKHRGGGHRMMAGGSLRFGPEAPESDWREAEERIVDAFLASRDIRSTAPRRYPFRDIA